MNNCQCCQALLTGSGGCLRCAARTFCSCGTVLSCSCGRAVTDHKCPNVVTTSTTTVVGEFIPTERVP